MEKLIKEIQNKAEETLKKCFKENKEGVEKITGVIYENEDNFADNIRDWDMIELEVSYSIGVYDGLLETIRIIQGFIKLSEYKEKILNLMKGK